MKWPGPLVEAEFLRRYKRFLADFRLENGEIVTAHCANTGSMVTCQEPGARAWLTYHDQPARKLKYSWQAVHMPDGWVGINTANANSLVREAIGSGVITELGGYAEQLAEQAYGKGSRVDFLLRGTDQADCYVEVKNVTLLLEPGVAGFPDAVTVRGAKHIAELEQMLVLGKRAVLIYCVQRESVREMAPAAAFDPQYTACLKGAMKTGLEVYAYKARFSREGVALTVAIPVRL